MTDLIEVKTTDLADEALNWAVAIADGHKPFVQPAHYGIPDRVFLKVDRDPEDEGALIGKRYKPSTDWGCCGSLIDKYHVQTSFNGSGFSRSPTGEHWCAYVCNDNGAETHPSGSGPSALIAVCRAIVVAKVGETAKVPKELMP